MVLWPFWWWRGIGRAAFVEVGSVLALADATSFGLSGGDDLCGRFAFADDLATSIHCNEDAASVRQIVRFVADGHAVCSSAIENNCLRPPQAGDSTRHLE